VNDSVRASMSAYVNQCESVFSVIVRTTRHTAPYHTSVNKHCGVIQRQLVESTQRKRAIRTDKAMSRTHALAHTASRSSQGGYACKKTLKRALHKRRKRLQRSRFGCAPPQAISAAPCHPWQCAPPVHCMGDNSAQQRSANAPTTCCMLLGGPERHFAPCVHFILS
jgi:hypothetical protein